MSLDMRDLEGHHPGIRALENTMPIFARPQLNGPCWSSYEILAPASKRFISNYEFYLIQCGLNCLFPLPL